MKYQAVIFDLFHTLTSLEESGAPGPKPHEMLGVSEQEWTAVWRRHADHRLRGQCQSVAEIVSDAVADLGMDLLPGQVEQICASRRARFRHALINVERDVLEGLRILRAAGLRLGLVSGADFDEIAAWEQSPLCPLIDVALFSCYVGLRKPEVEFYRLMCEQLSVEPRRCLYIGDGGSDEHLGAREVGMTPVLLTRHLELIAPDRIGILSERCDAIVRDVKEVLDLLREPARADVPRALAEKEEHDGNPTRRQR